MTDAEIIQRAKQTFVLDTPTDRLAREVIAMAERATQQRDELQGLLAPLRDSVLFARSQRRPMGIGQDFPRAPACVSIQIGAEYGRERDNAGFWIESDELATTDSDSPSPCHRIALALIRLAYAVAEKVKPQKIMTAKEELLEEMRDTSELCVCAQWLMGLEFVLWDALKTGDRVFPGSMGGEIDIERLRNLSARCGGWWIWDEDSGAEKFVTLAEWETIRKAIR